MNYPFKIPINCQQRWTSSAVDCYQIGCRCSRCYIKMICETECKMKQTVLSLVKKFGIPKV